MYRGLNVFLCALACKDVFFSFFPKKSDGAERELLNPTPYLYTVQNTGAYNITLLNFIPSHNTIPNELRFAQI